MHDERYYTRPDEFNPERFFQPSDGGKESNDHDPLRVVFGFGRRYENSSYLLLSSSRWYDYALDCVQVDSSPIKGYGFQWLVY